MPFVSSTCGCLTPDTTYNATRLQFDLGLLLFPNNHAESEGSNLGEIRATIQRNCIFCVARCRTFPASPYGCMFLSRKPDSNALPLPTITHTQTRHQICVSVRIYSFSYPVNFDRICITYVKFNQFVYRRAKCPPLSHDLD